jgi:hypothetical protein
MKPKFEIAGVLVTLHIDGEQKLFLMLTNDGMIRRAGDGSEDCIDADVFIGKSDGKEFAKIVALSGDVINKWLGSYAAPKQTGKPCKLVVGFRDTNEGEVLSEWEYGTESQGPPPEVGSLVVCAVRATDSWHQQQKSTVVR